MLSCLCSASIHAALIAGAALVAIGSMLSDDASEDEDGDYRVSLAPAPLRIDPPGQSDGARFPWITESAPAARGSALAWSTDVAAALRRAASQNRPLLVFSTIGAPDGYACLGGHLMRSMSFADRRLVDLLNAKFVVVWNNEDPGRAARGVQASYSAAEMAAYPEGGGGSNLHTVVAAPDGTVLEILQGYWSADLLLEELEFALGLTTENRLERHAARRRALQEEAAKLLAAHPEEVGKRVKDSPILRRKAALDLLSRNHSPEALGSIQGVGSLLPAWTKSRDLQICV
jgi:hypothetical protein